MKVIVIGAGMAGLSAAHKLEQLGIDVVILEGRHRTGGRICQAEEFDVPIDLGASWIHGVEGNPLASIAGNLKLHLDVTDNPSLTSGDYFEVYDEDGKIFDKEVETKMRDKFDELTKVGRQFMDALGKDLPLETVLSLEECEQEKLSKQELRFFNWLKSGIEGWDNTNLSNLSSRGHYWENENQFAGGDGFVVGGFYNLMHGLSEDFMKKGKILTNHIVKSIEYSENSVSVETDKGTLTADYAICTASLGVLKTDQITFEPRLPDWKTSSVQKLGFGLMNKIILEFPEVFWKKEVEGMGYVGDQRGEFNFFLNLYNLTKRPILMGFVAADFAHLIETWTDEQILEKVMITFHKIFQKDPNKFIPYPTKFRISRWKSDQFARGSYSFLAYGSTLNDIEKLARPVGRLHFAGEATYKPLGFTHGAYLSGIREAERIHADITKQNSMVKETSKETSVSIPRFPQQQPAMSMSMSMRPKL